MRMKVLLTGAVVLLVAALTAGWYLRFGKADVKGLTVTGDRVRITGTEGRRVALHYGEEGLVERHRAARGAPWSEPRVLYRTGEYDCQSLTLATHEDTVAAIADFGYGCPAGSPPDYSIAAVASLDDLDDWDVKTVEGFDGWEHVRFSADGDHVRFLYPTLDGTATLSWRSFWGFSEPDLNR
jgi:hypothetical protein